MILIISLLDFFRKCISILVSAITNIVNLKRKPASQFLLTKSSHSWQLGIYGDMVILMVVSVTFAELSGNWKRRQKCVFYTTSTLLHCLQQYLTLVTMVLWWNTCFMEHLMSSFPPSMYVPVSGLYERVHVHLFIDHLWLLFYCNFYSELF